MAYVSHLAGGGQARSKGAPQRVVVLWDRDDLPTPEGWCEIFADMTTVPVSGQWGRRAALYIAQVRERTGEGPTFSELFRELMPDTDGAPGLLPEEFTSSDRQYAAHRFRYGCAIAWANLGWIRWRRKTPRSLDAGPRFHLGPRTPRHIVMPRGSDAELSEDGDHVAPGYAGIDVEHGD